MSGIVRTEHTEDGTEHFVVPPKVHVRDHDPVIRTEHSHLPEPAFHPTPPPPEPPPAAPRRQQRLPPEVMHERTFTARAVVAGD